MKKIIALVFVVFMILPLTACDILFDSIFVDGDDNYNGELYAPTGLTASDGGYLDKIVISWNAVNGADEYAVFRGLSEYGQYGKLGVVTGTSANYQDDSGNIYWFKVKALRGSSDQSDFSNADSGYTKTAGSGSYKLKTNWFSSVSGDSLVETSRNRTSLSSGSGETSMEDVDNNTTVLKSIKSAISSISNESYDNSQSTEKSTRSLKTKKWTHFTGDFDQIMVKLKDQSVVKTRSGEINPTLNKMGKVDYRPNEPMPELVTVKPNQRRSAMTDQDWIEMLDYYNALPEVEYACPDYKIYMHGTPNDTRYSDQWNMDMINMPDAWDITTGESSVIVAVLDSGFAHDLEDSPVNVVDGYDFADKDDNVYPPAGGYYNEKRMFDHGTHVAGTIAQASNNNKGVAGMAPGVSIMPLKVFADSGSGGTSALIKAIQYAIDNGANVINMSLGSRGHEDLSVYYDPMETKINEAFNAGIALFAASGNSAKSGWDTDHNGTYETAYDYTVDYPAGYKNVMAVGAVGPAKKRSTYSQYGTGEGIATNYGIDIMAPGGDIKTAYSQGILQQTTNSGDKYGAEYDWMQGTSMACPHVAGLAGLMLSVNPKLTPQAIYNVIKETADKSIVGYTERECGAGLINPASAIAKVIGDTNFTQDTAEGILSVGDEAYYQIRVKDGKINATLNHKAGERWTLSILNSSGVTLSTQSTPTSGDQVKVSYEVASSGTYKIMIKRNQ